MDRKLIFSVLRIRKEGRVIPRHHHAFAKLPTGTITIVETNVVSLNRRSLVATVWDPESAAEPLLLEPWDENGILRDFDRTKWRSRFHTFDCQPKNFPISLMLRCFSACT